MGNDEAARSSSVLEHRSLPEQVHEILRLRILNNELPAGAPLAEVPLAAEFGVSRTTIRSAMRELQAERLIEVSPRRGSTVSRMSDSDIREVCYARYVLEAAAYHDALPGNRERLVADMESALARMESAARSGDTAGVILTDTDLHRAVMTAAGHPVLLDLWESLNGQMGALMRSDLDRQGIGLDVTAGGHARLLSVIRERAADEVIAALRLHYLDPGRADS
jgi:GntR family transcriptional regulator, rspAB operon transcriptional repressor